MAIMVEQSFSTIEVQLTQRYDLIPKLVETVKQYMGHERSLLEKIVRPKPRSWRGDALQDFSQAQIIKSPSLKAATDGSNKKVARLIVVEHAAEEEIHAPRPVKNARGRSRRPVAGRNEIRERMARWQCRTKHSQI